MGKREEQIKNKLGSGYRIVEPSRPRASAVERDSASSGRRAVVSSRSPGLEGLKAALVAGQGSESSRRAEGVARSSDPERSTRRGSEDKATEGSRGSSLSAVLVETTPDPTDRRSTPVRHKALVLNDEVVGVSDKPRDGSS